MKFTCLAICLLYNLLVISSIKCHSKEPDPKSLRSDVLGVWSDEFDDNVYIIFFPNGTALFSFVTPPEKPLSEWHQKATWIEIDPGSIEVTFNNKTSVEKEVYILHSRSKDVLVSPHTGSLRRVNNSNRQ